MEGKGWWVVGALSICKGKESWAPDHEQREGGWGGLASPIPIPKVVPYRDQVGRVPRVIAVDRVEVEASV